MLPRLHFGGHAATEAFAAHGSRWSRSAWVRFEAVDEDLKGHLEEALNTLMETSQDRVLVTFDFPEQRNGEPGFRAKLWLPERVQMLPCSADGPADSIATRAQGLQPNDADLLHSMARLEPLFNEGQLDKVVLAQRLRTDVPPDWKLERQAEGQAWTLNLEESDRAFYAKSPEALLRWQDDRLESMALAGTTGRSSDAAEDRHLGSRLLESEKDRREHRSVVAHIRQNLEANCHQTSESAEPELVRLPGLQHLCTRLHARGPRLHPLLLAARLHPTPALCGEPRLQALRYLQSVEGFPRGLYGGVIGWFSRSSGALIVGLRAIQRRGNQLELISGAGCVAGSNPEQELEEIRLKRAAILREAGLHLA